jgi:hypothetical protein
MNIRLDFISKFRNPEVATEAMTDIRKRFMEQDNYLVALASSGVCEAFQRAVELARTHNEQCLQYTIKSLCLLWEDKETTND